MVQQFEERLAPGQRSGFLAKLIERWLEERQREELRSALIEGCKEMCEVFGEVDREWNCASNHLWRGLDGTA